MNSGAESLDCVCFNSINSEHELANFLLALFFQPGSLPLILDLIGMSVFFEEVGETIVLVLEENAHLIFFDLFEGREDIVTVLPTVVIAHFMKY